MPKRDYEYYNRPENRDLRDIYLMNDEAKKQPMTHTTQAIQDAFEEWYLSDDGFQMSPIDKANLIKFVQERDRIAREEERGRVKMDLMNAESHSHPGEPGLYKAWSDILKALTTGRPSSEEDAEELLALLNDK